MRSIPRDAAWLVVGQCAAAAGALIGVRLLTETLPPAHYGVVALALAAVALLLATISTPFTQAAMHFYPARQCDGNVDALRISFYDAMRTMALFCSLVMAAIIAWFAFNHRALLYVPVLIGALLLFDVRRSIQLSLLNASHRHRRYAVWVSADAWLRPLCAYAAVVTLDASPSVVLAAYAIVSLGLHAVLSTDVWAGPARDLTPAESGSRELWAYAIPLIPVGAIGWMNSLSDRYIIGAMLDLHSAGMYAAVFGLASAPFIMLTTLLEQTFRPRYQAVVSERRRDEAQAIHRTWTALALVASCAGVITFLIAHGAIAQVFLGAEYRAAAELMPWIAAGYGLRAVGYAQERICYAHARTGLVLAIQTSVAAATLALTPLGVYLKGLAGAAHVLPVIFLIYVVLAGVLARRTERQQLDRATKLEPANIHLRQMGSP